MKRPENRVCADCHVNTHPRWTSWSIGVFICIRCSGIHRGMGTHISRVKSADLDAWTDDQTQMMIKWGNKRANKYSPPTPGRVSGFPFEHIPVSADFLAQVLGGRFTTRPRPFRRQNRKLHPHKILLKAMGIGSCSPRRPLRVGRHLRGRSRVRPSGGRQEISHKTRQSARSTELNRIRHAPFGTQCNPRSSVFTNEHAFSFEGEGKQSFQSIAVGIGV